MDNIRDLINLVSNEVDATYRGIVRLQTLENRLTSAASKARDGFRRHSLAHCNHLLSTFRSDSAFASWLLGVDIVSAAEPLAETLSEDVESAIESLDDIQPKQRFALYLSWVLHLRLFSVYLCMCLFVFMSV